ncbi:phosphoglycolate phosphatase, bacterial [Planobispora rosea]|uniref:Phosphoglycolate phosphatase, bacterial n=1 Tax=Planobispora rosea TaxID=35762 RepID=A0A8J3WF23_PLARO|nr:HAD-IA family hydrolase [Planobispora rosea]GGS84728.1 phosphoglycolate phosphatase, bacterial [Planobispora rosea]GIH86432.1 phosphoglycolate phosphatase, bacterial [Planobispora rosea]
MRPAALLDLDGVLLDSAAAHRNTLAAVATCATGQRVTAADLPADALARPRCAVLAELGVDDPDQACERWWDAALAAASQRSRLFPGVLAGLAALRRAGVALAVVTVQERHRLPWLLPADLAALLEVTVTRHDAPPKPAPDGLHLALRRLGVAHHRALFVGDSITDIHSGHAAGVFTLGAAWGYAGAERLQAAGAHAIVRRPRHLAWTIARLLIRCDPPPARR